MFEKVEFSNFKSFEELSISLDNFNVLIGPNASGKTNFVQFFQFLQYLTKEDLDDSIGLLGGEDYLSNYRLDDDTIEISVSISGDPKTEFEEFLLQLNPGVDQQGHKPVDSTHSIPEIEIKGYDLKFNLSLSEPKHEITYEEINVNLVVDGKAGIYVIGESTYSGLDKDNLFENEEIKDLFHISFLTKFLLGDISQKLKRINRIDNNAPSLILNNPYFSEIRVYDFNIKKAKYPASLKSRKTLASDGTNLTIVLKNLFKDEEKKQEFKILLKQCLDFIHDIKFEEKRGQTIAFELIEEFDVNNRVPSIMVSEGTVVLMAIITALFFESGKFIILEEPERYIHPSLMAKFMELVEVASKRKQILITTHNPQLLRYTPLSRILLCKRDQNGFSTIEKLEARDDLKYYMDQELGIEDLFVDNKL